MTNRPTSMILPASIHEARERAWSRWKDQQTEFKPQHDLPLYYGMRDRIAITPADTIRSKETLNQDAFYHEAGAAYTDYLESLHHLHTAILEKHDHAVEVLKKQIDEWKETELAKAGESHENRYPIIDRAYQEEGKLTYFSNYFRNNLAGNLLKLTLHKKSEFTSDQASEFVKYAYPNAKEDILDHDYTQSLGNAKSDLASFIEQLINTHPLPAMAEEHATALQTFDYMADQFIRNREQPETIMHLLRENMSQRLENGDLKDQALQSHIQALKDRQLDELSSGFHLIRAEEKEQSEIAYKKLFLETLGILAKRKGINLDPDLLMLKPKDQPVIGSQSILIRHDFTSITPENLDRYDLGVGGSETTTPYHFRFGFISDINVRADITKSQVAQPLFLLDNDALTAMETAGVKQETISAFFQGFMQMASMAEHDYLHAAILPLREEADHKFAYIETPYLEGLEKHALSMHAEIVEELFQREADSEGNSRRKDAVLRWASRDFSKIASIQQQMLASAKTPQQQEEALNVATYLTEIYAHRLFRVISPADKDLKKPLTGPKAMALPSVEEALQRIQLASPQKVMEYVTAEASNLERLPFHCAAGYSQPEKPLQPLYIDIHTDRRNLMQSRKTGTEVWMDNLEVVDVFKKCRIGLEPETRYAHREMGRHYARLDENIRQGASRMQPRKALEASKDRWAVKIAAEKALRASSTEQNLF